MRTVWQLTGVLLLASSVLQSAVAAVLRVSLARRELAIGIVTTTTNSIDVNGVASPSTRTRAAVDETTKSGNHEALPRGNRVTLQNFGNVQYVGSVGIGNPPQYVDMAFDTGSSDTWVPGVHCASCSPHHRFDALQSTTFFDTRAKFYDEYGSGSVSGTVGIDSITVSGYAVTNVRFGVARAESTRLQTFLADGIFGLGFENLAHITRPTAFAKLAGQHADLANMFAFHLTPEASRTGSELHLGGYDLSVVGPNASFHYTPVVQLPPFDAFLYWSIQMNDFSVLATDDEAHTDSSNDSHLESVVLATLCRPFCYAIVDTGTSFISVPARHFDDVVRAITRDCDCDGVHCSAVAVNDFPVLRFGIAPDHVLLLQPQDYISCADYGQCTLQLQASSDHCWVLGDVFLKTYYTLFDAEHMRIGFACNSSVCRGSGTGDVFGAATTSDRALRAWETALLLCACVAGASALVHVWQLHSHSVDDTEDREAARASCLQHD
ncbi:unnamed protein product [Hyaloperonospora brassicae]|uniref:Peptidase A1 domain-containing protein n=1 Tax=Hyaloperonospora brassicae TaxID=162125 RepID=A0AAV0TYJ6_HYABA|nr:unnamed protein product [Hyaloperonospora brassicae]